MNRLVLLCRAVVCIIPAGVPGLIESGAVQGLGFWSTASTRRIPRQALLQADEVTTWTTDNGSVDCFQVATACDPTPRTCRLRRSAANPDRLINTPHSSADSTGGSPSDPGAHEPTTTNELTTQGTS